MQNYVSSGDVLEFTVTSPAVPTSGVQCIIGAGLTGVATLAEGEGGVSAATKTMIKLGGGVYDLSVTDTATGGIAVGAVLYIHTANPPLINNVSAGGYFFGYALEALLTGVTDTINVRHVQSPGAGVLGVGTSYPELSAAATVKANAATATMADADFPKNNTNTGAGGAIVLTLPAAANVIGQSCRITALVAQTITLTPVAGTAIYLNGSGVVSKYLLMAGVIGNYVNLYCDGTSFYVTGYSGVVTKEA